MSYFLIEVYAPRSTDVTELEAAARVAAREASGVRYVESIYVSEDETCFHLFEAPSRVAVSRAANAAPMAVQRVVRACRRGCS